MKAAVLVMFAGVLMTAGMAFSLSGCKGDPAPPATPAAADVVDDAVENQQFCPVMPNMEIDRNIYVDHEGKRVYFCCAGCVAAFQAEPGKYVEKLHNLHEGPEAAVDHDHDHDH